jgi:hypothetical protein
VKKNPKNDIRTFTDKLSGSPFRAIGNSTEGYFTVESFNKEWFPEHVNSNQNESSGGHDHTTNENLDAS